jgi:hypothetical protein
MVALLAQSRRSESGISCYLCVGLLRIESKAGINPHFRPFYTYIVVRFPANHD